MVQELGFLGQVYRPVAAKEESAEDCYQRALKESGSLQEQSLIKASDLGHQLATQKLVTILRGNAEYEIAIWFLWGKHGFKKNEEEAAFWFRAAVKDGNEIASELGEATLNKGKFTYEKQPLITDLYKKAIANLETDRKKVPAKLLYDLGLLLEKGVDGDVKEAIVYYKFAAKEQCPFAKSRLEFLTKK